MSRQRPEMKEGQPPIFAKWSHLYLFVLVCHAIIITLFYLLTKYYS
jgi:hypothetical protein